MELSGEIIGVIVGGILGIVSGVVVTYFTIRFGEKRTKQYTSRVLLSEVEANQNRLRPLANIIRLSDEGYDIGKIQLQKSISFDRTVYSALPDKIGLLDPKSREKVVQYYVKTKFMEDELRLIHEISSSTLTDYSEEQIELIKRDQTKDFFTNTEEAYNIGKELIKSLKEQI
jgi:hypothetical protein